MIMVLDIETWYSSSFAFGVIWENQGDFTVFQTAESMKEYLLGMIKKSFRVKDRITILGHNIAYDLNWIFGNIEIYFQDEYQEFEQKHKNGKTYKKRRYFKRLLSRSGRFYRAMYWNLEFLDTFNLFPLSLAKAGEVLNYPKGITPDKFLKSKPEMITQEDINYCVRDCEVCFMIYHKVKDFVEENNGKLGLTIASSGLSILKNFKNKEVVKMLNGMNTDKKLQEKDEFFRKSYFGGRSEVFHQEIENGNYYDINSLYPSVMADENVNFPDPLSLRPFSGHLDSVLDQYEGVADITVHIPSMFIPPLPYRRKSKINYPCGTFRGTWNFPEIRQALRVGGVVEEEHKIIIADRIKSPFKDYVHYLYEERKKSKLEKNPYEKIIKLFLNSVYGKFAQKSFSNKIVKLEDAESFSEYFEVDGVQYAREISEEERSRTDLLCLASYVTSYARVVLYGYLTQCENVCYCDTDSIVTNSELPTSTELGEMKLEDKIIYGSFKNRKDYYIETKEGGFCKRKGVSIKNLVRIGKIEVTEEIKELIKAHDPYWNRLIHESNNLVYDRIIKSREGLISDEKEAGKTYRQKKNRIMLLDDGRIFEDGVSMPLTIDIDGNTLEEVEDYEEEQIRLSQRYNEVEIKDYKTDYWMKKKYIEKVLAGDESLYDKELNIEEQNKLERLKWGSTFD